MIGESKALSLTIALLFIISASLLATITTASSIPQPPRDQTVVIGGGLWSPPTNFNPLVPWSATTGTIGLIYETLYLYIPNLNKWIPWIASDMPKWINSTAIEIKLRNAYWWDGKPITSEDIKFTYYTLPKEIPSLYYANILSYLINVATPDARTVIFKFNATSMNYPQFYYYLYTLPILPEHIYQPIIKKVGMKILKMPIVGASKPEDIVGSGMYRVYYTTSDTLYYVRADNWWGKAYFGLPGPKYIKYIMVFSNQVAIAMLVRGDLDWSNFFIPGVPTLVNRYNFLVTFYKTKPYYLPANVAVLFMNVHKAPLNDPRFRKALYYAIDIDRIINEVYQGAVEKANPVGLINIPAWQQFLAKDLIEKFGYKYDPKMAEKLLNEAGYVDRNGDGWRDLPNGTTIDLKIIVPYGWTDWMQAAIIIADCLKAVGIKAEASFPAYGVYADKMYKGEFDLLINNFGSFVSISPWTYYEWLLWPDAPKIGQYSWSGNFGRFYNKTIRSLLEEISHTPLSNINKLKQLYRELELVLLQQMPYIPLWYNAAWFQATTIYWTGWPTSGNPYGMPLTWPGTWQYGGLLTLLHLKSMKVTGTTTSHTVSPTQTTTSPQVTIPAKTTTSTTLTHKTSSTPISTTPAITTSTPTTTPVPASSNATYGIIVAIIIIGIIVGVIIWWRKR